MLNACIASYCSSTEKYKRARRVRDARGMREWLLKLKFKDIYEYAFQTTGIHANPSPLSVCVCLLPGSPYMRTYNAVTNARPSFERTSHYSQL